jgi:PAS domain S-box-containing protein
MRRLSSPERTGYAIAVVATAAMLVVQFAPLGVLGDLATAMPFALCVILAAWFGRWKAGLLATALGVASLTLLFTLEPDMPRLSLSERFALGCFLTSGVALSVVLGQARDTRERRRNARALEAAMKRLQLVTETMSAPVTRCTRDMRYEWVSRPYADWLHHPVESIVGQPIADVIGDAAFAQLAPYFGRVLAGEEVQYEEAVEFKGIGTRWIQARYTPTHDVHGVVDGWVGVVLDIDDRRRLEDALRDADRRKDVFLATLSHELRNPLAPVRNAVEILKNKDGLDPDTLWCRDVIDRQIHQLSHLLDDLIDASRIAGNRLELRRRRVSLADVVDVAVETSRPLMKAAGHELRLELPPGPVELYADPVRLAQVLANLLNNAAKYTDPGGHLELRAELCGSEAVIAVKDDGMGIERAALPRLFDMFSQETPALERAQGGLGIGLSLVKALVELHGGSVEARSDGPARGSEFVVRLPLEGG